MKTLFIDTSLGGVALGYYDDQTGKTHESYLQTVRGQAEHLIPMVQKLLADASVQFQDLSQIITTLGPGSFTGLRLGLSAAKSLSLALNIPALGISTLQAVALCYVQDHQPKTHFAVIIETKRADYYVQIFSAKGAGESEAQALSLENLENLLKEQDVQLIIGDACQRVLNETQSDSKPNHHTLEQLSTHFLASHLTRSADHLTHTLDPIYLRGADVSVPKHTPRPVSVSDD